MDTEKLKRFNKVLKDSLQIKVDVSVEMQGSQGVLVRFSGELGGKRADYAWRRRNQLATRARELGRKYGVNVEIDFSGLIDAYSSVAPLAINALSELLETYSAKVTFEFNRASEAIITLDLGAREMSSLERSEIQKAVRGKIAALFSGGIGRIVIIDGGMSEPSGPQILRLLRIYGPCDADLLMVELEKLGYRVDSSRKMKQKLDELIKRMLVKYLEENQYALTALALDRMPAVATRNSLDVQRALRFGREKKW